MKKRFLALLLAVSMAVSMLAMSAAALGSASNTAVQTAITLGAMDTSQTGSLDAAGIEQQLLGKCGLTGVRVADDRECAARRDFIRQACHADPFLH